MHTESEGGIWGGGASSGWNYYEPGSAPGLIGGTFVVEVSRELHQVSIAAENWSDNVTR